MAAYCKSNWPFCHNCCDRRWGHYDQLAACFFILAVVGGLVNGMGINGTTKVFVAGCAKLVNAAFIIGFANGISVILTQGQILNTIVTVA